jgi:hypothetical protein
MSKKVKKTIGTSKPNDIEELEFVTSVNMRYYKSDGNKPKRVYHGVYASQVYGTMFAIYGYFRSPKNQPKNCCLVSGVNLRLLNYKGVVNIGFPDTKGDAITNGDDIIIDFNIQGLRTNDEMEITFSHPIEFRKPGRKRIIFNRKLIPLPHFEVDQKNQDNLSKLKRPRPSSVPATPCFDTEFHYRDGVDYYDAIIRDGMAGVVREAFSFRCVQSNVDLVYY